MIYQQPVRYEYHLIAPPTLLIVGAEITSCRSATTRSRKMSPDSVTLLSFRPRQLVTFPAPTRVVIPDCGHIPHLEFPDQFLTAFLPFLAS